MLWILLSFLAALCESLKDVFNKRGLKVFDEYIVSWALRFFASLFLLPLLFFIKIPELGTKFWIALAVSGTLNLIATILVVKAIKYSDLSITVPMVTFTPLFLLITSPLIVGEFPTPLGLIGVLLIVFGSYILNIKEIKNGYLAPFKAVLKEKGPKLMLAVAFIWSITSNFDKIGVLNSSSLFWAVAINSFIAVFMFPMLFFAKQNGKGILINLKVLIPIGLFVALTTIFQMIAIKMALVAYVISIKRTSVVMGVLFGCLFFKEKGLKERLLGAVIMILGVLLITLAK